MSQAYAPLYPAEGQPQQPAYNPSAAAAPYHQQPFQGQAFTADGQPVPQPTIASYPQQQQPGYPQPHQQQPGAYPPQQGYPGQPQYPQMHLPPQQQGYPGPHGQVVVAVPAGYGANMGQPGHLPRGQWSDGICDCFDGIVICLLSMCVLPVRWAQTAERMNWMPFANGLLTYGLPWLVMIIFETLFNVTNKWYWALPALIANIVCIGVGTQYRSKLRAQYGIQGSECEDCLLHTFCRCCAIAQEARHVDRDFAIPI